MFRIYVEKITECRVQAQQLFEDIQQSLDLPQLTGLRLLQRYDVDGLNDSQAQQAQRYILSEAQVDQVSTQLPLSENEHAFAVEYLPGQFDQRADSAAQCIQILTQEDRPTIQHAKVIILQGELDSQDIARIESFTINAVDSRKASLDIPETLQRSIAQPSAVRILEGFTQLEKQALADLRQELGLAMSQADIEHCQQHFASLPRDPSITELRLLDTYWSDHCRHSTFLTTLSDIRFDEDPQLAPVQDAWQRYQNARKQVYGENIEQRPVTLMDLALVAMKTLRQAGKLPAVEVSEEINAASIVVPVDIDGQEQNWLVMFKNETHNHPTEIEPFGGAATCLGGAIRDPLSGRSYVYQAMRVTGAADPTVPFAQTLPGKLPQKRITRGAAHGYSSYGNQIGLATGAVHEFYHPGFLAKRMEVGAVIAATPQANVYRGTPQAGDIIILMGGRTGRDGVGGATGSSKEHTDTALENSAEVQKGDAPTERKLQRLFRQAEFSQKIVRCNDFGAGGVSVAIGELADSLDINLDAVLKKYDGLDGSELALSESQERMAIVCRPQDVEFLQACAAAENVESSVVATVTDSGALIMKWRGDTIVHLDRAFLDTNGVLQDTNVHVQAPSTDSPLGSAIIDTPLWADGLRQLAQNLNHCSQKGLIEHFDSSIGAGTVLHPLGGKTQRSAPEAMAAMIPVLEASTTTATLMSYGYHPDLASWSPFHGAAYAVIESICRIVASGGDYTQIHLTFQEYFEKLGQDPSKWGKPFAALLGAYRVQEELELAAIGGKDSMSGSFNELHVPPTLVSFAVAPVNAAHVLSPECKQAGNQLVLLQTERGSQQLPDFAQLRQHLSQLTQCIQDGHILSAQSLRMGGIAEALLNMLLGNELGLSLNTELSDQQLFQEGYGHFLLEIEPNTELPFPTTPIGTLTEIACIQKSGTTITLQELADTSESTLQDIFPTTSPASESDPAAVVTQEYKAAPFAKTSKTSSSPRVCIPVFPGTNCEYDLQRAFQQAGAQVVTPILRNTHTQDIESSLQALQQQIEDAQILMLPGGFSAGDEPDGSGKFIATVFHNPRIADATMDLLRNRDGLILGICNGFQALVKLGLLPYGEIRQPTAGAPTLTYNNIGRHISCYVKTRVTSTLSPWLAHNKLGQQHSIPVSHGEGKFFADQKTLIELRRNGQIATQYTDNSGRATMREPHNPNGSYDAIEGITSKDGRIFGKMGHSERIGPYIAKNIPGDKDQQLFQAGVQYFL